MKFELSSRLSPSPVSEWIWQATVQGEVIAIGPHSYPDEKSARSAIAKARKGFAGAKFAKVEVV